MRIEVIRQYNEFVQMETEWNELLGRSLHPMVFLTHQWIDTWWKSFGAGRELFILLVYCGEELAAIAPFMRHQDEHTLIGRTNTKIKLEKIEFIANIHSNRSGLILSANPAECCDAITDYLFNDCEAWDMLSLKYLVASSPAVNHLSRSLDKRNVHYNRYFQRASPYVPLDCSWEDYLKTIDSRFKRNLSSRLKKLEKLGKVRLEVYRDSERLEEILNEVFDVASKSWKAEEETALSSTPQYKDFYSMLAYKAAKENWLEIYILYIDEKPLVFDFCMRYGEVLLLLKTEFDDSYRNYGVGNLLKLKQFETIFGTSLVEFDFLGPSMPWKKYWANGYEREHIHLDIFNKSSRGHLLKHFYTVKRLMKKMIKKSSQITAKS